jgi:hypothetical protein
MKIPGFTADVTLYQTSRRYRRATNRLGDLYVEQIRPQFYIWSGDRQCIPDCVCIGPGKCPCCGSLPIFRYPAFGSVRR